MDAKRTAALEAMQRHKAPRRQMVADDVSVLWESQQTVDHQIREMQAMEDDPQSLAAIMEGYEELRPNGRHLTATVSVEVRHQPDIKARLGYYAGLEHSFRLEAAGSLYAASIIGDHGTATATTAVTYLAFDVPEDIELTEAQLVVDHARIQFRAPLPGAVIESFQDYKSTSSA